MILLTVILITENIQPQLMEMGVIQEEKNFWQLVLQRECERAIVKEL